MEILIQNNNAAEYIQEANKILWKEGMKKTIYFFIFLLVFGIFFLVWGLKTVPSPSSSVSKYDENTRTLITNTTFYNFHIAFGLGIGLMLVFLYFLFQFRKQKKQFLSALKKTCDKYKKLGNNYILRINEQGLYYEDLELTRGEKWGIFSTYKIHSDYLFLFLDSYYLTSTPIPLKLLSQEEATELLEFVKAILTEKRN